MKIRVYNKFPIIIIVVKAVVVPMKIGMIKMESITKNTSTGTSIDPKTKDDLTTRNDDCIGDNTISGNNDGGSNHSNDVTATMSTISSEASTEIMDNRTMKDVMLNATSRSADAAFGKSTTATSMSPKKRLPPSFFASTRPVSPTSPPKLTRRRPFEMADRSISTVAVVQDSESTPRCAADHETKTPPTTDDRQRLHDNPQNDSGNENGVASESSTLHSDGEVDASTASEEKVHDTRQRNGTEDSGNDDIRFHQYPHHQADEHNNVIAYEEEATPEQTAFGKELLFRRVLPTKSKQKSLDNDDNTSNCSSDDVLSTASEMGTIIDANGRPDARMDDLRDMMEQDDPFYSNKNKDAMTFRISEEHFGSDDHEDNILFRSCDENIRDNNISPIVSSPPRYDTKQQFSDAEPFWDRSDCNDPRLSLPILESEEVPFSETDRNWAADEKKCTDEKNDRQESSSQKNVMRDVCRIDITENDIQPVQFYQQQFTASDYEKEQDTTPSLEHPTTANNVTSNAATANSTSSILSKAMRRIGNNFIVQTNAYSSSNRTITTNSISAPTTPRASNNNYSTSFLLPTSPIIGGGGSSSNFVLSSPRWNRYKNNNNNGNQDIVREEESSETVDDNKKDGTAMQSSIDTEAAGKCSPPMSFLLRSPGSSARLAANSSAKKKNVTTNGKEQQQKSRPSPPSSRNFQNIFQTKSSGNDISATDDNTNTNNQRNPLWIARSCFSFDACNDAALDDQFQFSTSAKSITLDGGGLFHHRTDDKEDGDDRYIPQSQRKNWRNYGYDPAKSDPTFPPQLFSSASWDVGGSSRRHHPASSKHDDDDRIRASPTRLSPFHRPSSPHRLPIRSRGTIFETSPARRSNNGSKSKGRSIDAGRRSDFSPVSTTTPNYVTDAMQLMSPQRIEIEREDALDILACLVERGVALQQEFDPAIDEISLKEEIGRQPDETKDSETKHHAETDATIDKNNSPIRTANTPTVSDIVTVVRELEDLSLAEERLDDFHDNSEAHERRKRALSELLKSHEYALEMKRVSQSASKWLDSIGRLSSPLRQDVGKESNDAASSKYDAKVVKWDNPQHLDQDVTSESASDDIGLLTAKAMLHSAQLELNEKMAVADRLNEELAKCRAEIGRLKSSSQTSVFRSPNRSILDISDEISVTEVDDEDEIDRSFENASPIPEVNDSGFLDRSFPLNNEGEVEVNKPTNNDEVDSALQYRAALDEANNVIRKLFSDLQRLNGDYVNDEVPTVALPLQSHISQQPKAPSPRISAIQQPENNHRLETSEISEDENYVTDWCDLSSSLPNPPSHGLRSPIVAAVLDQWTDDRSLQESLLCWMDRVLDGSNPESIPPLTLSALDHQVRDGFALHVLPVLLRRRDIRVDVKTRIHRRTVHDLAISVDTIPQLSEHFVSDHHNGALMHNLIRHRHLETTSASSDVGVSSSVMTHSTATTAVISNGLASARTPFITPTIITNRQSNSGTDRTFNHDGAISSRMSYDEMADDFTTGLDQQPGLMNALGGALGGLLSRRKTPTSASSNLNVTSPQIATPMQAVLEGSPSWTAGGLAKDFRGFNDDVTNDDASQPFDRVVSAPPGRIGVTFVEYRGHCMVSDVAEDSPLVGWIFPSDVLIAIDEVPVSGMRVRDIIKILKDRKNRQRALRVISGHAMNDFTLHSTIVADTSS